jgi:hypothetical protein
MRKLMCALVLAAATTAAADGTPAADPTQAPGFALIERFDGVSRGGADMTYFVLDGTGLGTLLRFDLHGQMVQTESGFGGYLRLPITTYSASGTPRMTAVGNLELGGIYIPKLTTPGLGVVIHGGVTLPTGEKGKYAEIGVFTGAMRPSDVYASLSRSSTIRLGVSPMFRSGIAFGRVDAGIDINVYLQDASELAKPGLHLDLGAGLDFGSVAVMGELSTILVTGKNGDSFAVAAISARGNAGVAQPYVSILLPLDKLTTDLFDVGLLLGLEAKI